MADEIRRAASARTDDPWLDSGWRGRKPADRHTRGGREMSVDSTRRRGGVLLLTLGLYLLSADIAHAQFRAAIQGTVTDPTGGAMPGASIVVLNNETGQSHDTVSNESGFYRVLGLKRPAGSICCSSRAGCRRR